MLEGLPNPDHDQVGRCVVKPDPCDPNPCGPGAECAMQNGNAICRCQVSSETKKKYLEIELKIFVQPGLIPNPDTISGCKPECVRDPDCQSGYICQVQYSTVQYSTSHHNPHPPPEPAVCGQARPLRPLPLRSRGRVLRHQARRKYLLQTPKIFVTRK